MLEGQILHYRILKRLGAGGMGEVYLAQDERLGRRVALKFLPRADAIDHERRERLRQEARALAALSHPGIAGVHALEEHEGRLFLVLEFVEGETLADRIGKRPLPVPEVIERGRALADALAHAHARGVVHRDIKPSNILLTPDGGTKLADFGLALMEGETRLTAEGSSPGTVDYMSPEQTHGAAVDRRTDIFSLGTVLYEALTGARPFSRAGLESTFHAIRAEEPEVPTAVRTGIPLELERIVLKCLRKDPAQRYQHADDLAADLHALSDQTKTSTSAGGAIPPTRPTVAAPARRRRLTPALIGAALVLFLILAWLLGGLRPGSRSPDRAEAAERAIAVLSFQNLEDPADSRREAVMAASLLTVGLGQSQVIPVLSLQRVHDVLRQMGKPEGGVSGRDALEVGRKAGAAYVVTGYIYRTKPDVVIGAEVAATEGGEVLTSSRVSAPAGEQGLFAAVDSLTAALRDGLAKAGFGVREARIDVAGVTTSSPNAYRLFVRGLDLLYAGNMDDAVEPLRAAVRADSNFAQAWYYLAMASWWAHDREASEAQIAAALRLGARLPQRDREGLEALRPIVLGDYATGADRYRRLVERYPDEKEFTYALGEALFHNEQYDEAYPALQRAIELDPAFMLPYVHVIHIDLAREDSVAAMAHAAQLRRADPASLGSVHVEMEIRGRLGDLEGAMRAAERILAADPQDDDAQRRVALMLALRGDADSVRERVRSIQGPPPETLRAIQALVSSLLLQIEGRYAEAERIADGALREFGSRMPSFFGVQLAIIRWRSLMEMGRYNDAIALDRTLVATIQRHFPFAAPGLQHRIDAHLHAGRIAEAERVLREFDRVIGPRSRGFERKNREFSAGMIALARGRFDDAIRLLSLGEATGPQEVREIVKRWHLARAHLGAGDRARGVAELEKVVLRGQFSGDATIVFPAMIVLAKERERDGRTEDALALYRRVAHQYRRADPGVRANQEAKAAIARIMQSRARAAAD